MPKLDEGALRRPDFQGGTPVALADGQTWYVPTPVLDGFHFRRGPDGKTRVGATLTAGPDYGALVDAYVDAETFDGQAVALFDLAFRLLGLNYTLTVEDAASLLPRYADGDPRQEANAEAWGAIARVAMGAAPKATQGGSAPA